MDGGSFGSSGGANYFFGFLFLFAIILLILVGCGVGTRRRLLSRRANPLVLEPWRSSSSTGEVTPPNFHEMMFVVAQATGWKDIMPLSATYLANKQDSKESATHDVESGHSITSYQPPTTESHFPSFPLTLLPTLRKTSSNSKIAAPSVDEIQLVITIAMPSPRADQQRLGTDQHVTLAAGFSSESNILRKKTPPEIQIGVETLPWRES